MDIIIVDLIIMDIIYLNGIAKLKGKNKWNGKMGLNDHDLQDLLLKRQSSIWNSVIVLSMSYFLRETIWTVEEDLKKKSNIQLIYQAKNNNHVTTCSARSFLRT